MIAVVTAIASLSPDTLAESGTMALEPFFLGYGVLGAVFVLVLLGWLGPKWVIDYLKAQNAIKDGIIEELTQALHRLADKEDAQREPRSRRRAT